MKLTPSQQRLHWRLWSRVKAIQMPGRETWTKAEEEQRRHALYAEALGADKSLTKFTNDDFDKVLGAMRAIVDPTNVDAQLHALNGAKKRKLYGITKLARSLGGDRNYIDGIVRTMNSERKLGSSILEELEPNELEKVMIALRQHERRGMVHEPEIAEMPF